MPTLSDIIVSALTEFIQFIFSPITLLINEFADDLLGIIVTTPNPNAVFTRPTNKAWPNLYDYYWDAIIPVSLFIWGLSLGLVILLSSMGHLFSGYHAAKLKRRAVSGLLGILSWWWIAALSLRFVDALAAYLVPSLSDISLFQTLSFAAIGVLGLAVSLTVDLVLFAILALIYFGRQLVLYLFVLLMPILIALWIPGVGPLAGTARFMEKLAGFYVPMLFLTIPVALFLRLGHLLGTSADLSMEGFGAWLMALVVPLFAVISPVILIWQAGSLFSAGESLGSHGSKERAKHRAAKTTEHTQATRTTLHDFKRGARDQPAVRDGTALLASPSRAYSAGQTARSTARSIKQRFTDHRERIRRPPSPPESDPDHQPTVANGGRDDSLDHLKQPRRSSTDRDDDRPPYIY